MADIKISQTVTLVDVTLDWLLAPLGLDQSKELATAVILALGTDALASVDDVLPDPDSTDRRGWWGNLDANEIWGGWPLGSRLWLLSRAKITDAFAKGGATVNNAQFYGQEALQPLVDKGIASAIDVQASVRGSERIDMLCTIFRGPQPAIQLRYQAMWDELSPNPPAQPTIRFANPLPVTPPTIPTIPTIISGSFSFGSALFAAGTVLARGSVISRTNPAALSAIGSLSASAIPRSISLASAFNAAGAIVARGSIVTGTNTALLSATGSLSAAGSFALGVPLNAAGLLVARGSIVSRTNPAALSAIGSLKASGSIAGAGAGALLAANGVMNVTTAVSQVRADFGQDFSPDFG